MKITLAQAVPLKKIIERRIQELVTERNSVSTVIAEKGEKFEAPTRTVAEVTNELNQTRADSRKLDTQLVQANLNSTVKWDGEDINIIEAIELAKQLRGEISIVKSFGNRKKQEKHNIGWQQESNSYVHTMYDPEEYRQKGLKLERQVNKLSQDIEAKNHSVEIEFASAEKYIEL